MFRRTGAGGAARGRASTTRQAVRRATVTPRKVGAVSPPSVSAHNGLSSGLVAGAAGRQEPGGAAVEGDGRLRPSPGGRQDLARMPSPQARARRWFWFVIGRLQQRAGQRVQDSMPMSLIRRSYKAISAAVQSALRPGGHRRGGRRAAAADQRDAQPLRSDHTFRFAKQTVSWTARGPRLPGPSSRTPRRRPGTATRRQEQTPGPRWDFGKTPSSSRKSPQGSQTGSRPHWRAYGAPPRRGWLPPPGHRHAARRLPRDRGGMDR